MPVPVDVKRKITLAAGDAFFVILSTYLAVFIRFHKFVNVLDYYTGAAAFYVIIVVSSLYVFDLYNLKYRFKSALYLARFLFALIAAGLVIAGTFYLFPNWKIGRGVFLLDMLLIFVSVFSWRLFFHYMTATAGKPMRTVIVGAGQAGETIYKALVANEGFIVVGFLDDNTEKANRHIGSHRVLGDSGSLKGMVERQDIDAVVVTIKDEKKPDLLKSIIQAKMNGIEIQNMASLYEELTGKLPVLHLSEGWMAYTPFHGTRRSVYNTHAKRLIDIALSFIGLLLASPIMALAGLAIRLDSKGPALYKQKRVGLNEAEFELVKFRSMGADAEANGAVWAQENDPRTTRVGKVIRKMRIDELPQMWNVLKGEMSFIGPRPERPEFVAKLKEEIPFYSFRHAVNPGITGWAQVNYRYGASKEDAIEKLQYDLFYIKNLSAFLDFHILIKTVRVVLLGKGAR